jgi:16S rRNA (cytidine1402-2'-O)-methyltransferase
MPSNSPTNDSNSIAEPATLYIVATPIGNRDDITLRALSILREVDQIAAEDTRKTRKFLALHHITNNLISYHEHNEAERTPKLLAQLQKGLSIALVCNAGTPTVSDPGYRLIEAALKINLNVIPIPGVSAATAALSVSGLPTDSFVFIGFLPPKKAKRLQQLSEIADETRTLIFYESPRRIRRLLDEINDIMGDRKIVLAREMTKIHEEFLRGRLSDVREVLEQRPEVKGECTLLVVGCDSSSPVNWDAIRAEIRYSLKSKGNHVSKIARDIAREFRLPKNKVYEEALKISGKTQKTDDK